MTRLRTVLLLALASLTVQQAPAQILFGEFGFTVTTATATAGDGCWGFDCSPRALTVPPGQPVALQVRAPFGAPYLILAAPSAPNCLSLPGIHNSLVLDGSLFPLVFGVIDQRNFSRYCYDGLTGLTLPLPFAPPGTQLALQAVAAIGTPQQPSAGLAFSSAVLLSVR